MMICEVSDQLFCRLGDQVSYFTRAESSSYAISPATAAISTNAQRTMVSAPLPLEVLQSELNVSNYVSNRVESEHL